MNSNWKKNLWKHVLLSNVDLLALVWKVTNTSNSFTFIGTPHKIPFLNPRFSSISLVNNLQSGSVGGVCLPSVKSQCVSECSQICGDDGGCIFGCEIGQFTSTNQCTSDCSDYGNSCLVSCFQTVDCIIRGCSNFIKFDIIVKGYKWISKDKNSRLAFTYSVTGKNTAKPIVNGNTLTFGDFWIQFSPNSYHIDGGCSNCGTGKCACNSNSTLQSNSTAYVSGGSSLVEFKFHKFKDGETLVNDPYFGLSQVNYEIQSQIENLHAPIPSSSARLSVSFAVFLSLLFIFLF